MGCSPPTIPVTVRFSSVFTGTPVPVSFDLGLATNRLACAASGPEVGNGFFDISASTVDRNRFAEMLKEVKGEKKLEWVE